MTEAWEIDGLADEGASIAHRLLCDLLMMGSRWRPQPDAVRAEHRDRAVERWPSLAATLARLEEAAPVSAGEGRADDEALMEVVEAVQSRATFRPGAEPDVVCDAAALACSLMEALRAAAAARDRERKRAWLIRAFGHWPALWRRMDRLVQAHAEASDMAAGDPANAVRGAEHLENIGALR